MGQFHRNLITKCTSLLLPLPSSPQLSLPALPPTAPLSLATRRRSSPLSPMLMSTELLMTTARPTSRRQKHKMSTVSLLVSHTREPPSPPLSPRRDTATPPPPTSPPLLTTLKRPLPPCQETKQAQSIVTSPLKTGKESV